MTLFHPRVIPLLLVNGSGLYKTIKFKDDRYIGDPINAVRIFNDKQADELCLIDIGNSRNPRDINFSLLADIASEAFMPLSYGGGVSSLSQVERLVASGFERVIVNSAFLTRPSLASEMVKAFGSSTIIAGIDVKADWLGRSQAVGRGPGSRPKVSPVQWAKQLEEMGVGEILLTSTDRDGTLSGFDLDLVRSVVASVNIPVIASGGASTVADFGGATRDAGASAVAAGSMFVFHGKHKAVLISYPTPEELRLVWSVGG